MSDPTYTDLPVPSRALILDHAGSLYRDYVGRVGEVFDVKPQDGEPLYFVRVDGVPGCAQLRRRDLLVLSSPVDEPLPVMTLDEWFDAPDAVALAALLD